MDSKDVALILALMESPVGTYREIKEILDDNPQTQEISVPTISRRIALLEEEGTIGGAAARIHLEKLDLQLVHVLIKPRHPWKERMNIFSQVFEDHPYTSHLNLVYGASNGLFVQLTLPRSSAGRVYLTELLDGLSDLDLIDEYRMIPVTTGLKRFRSNISSFNFDTHRWDVDYEQFLVTLQEGEETVVNVDHSSVLSELDKLDIILIRELFIDARRSQVEILDLLQKSLDPKAAEEEDEKMARILTKEREKLSAEEIEFFNNFPKENHWQHYQDSSTGQSVLDDLPITRQTLSRRIAKLHDLQIISEYDLYYDRSAFGIFNQALFIVNRDDEIFPRLITALDHTFPFPGSLSLADNHGVLVLNLPVVELMQIAEILQQMFSSADFYLFSRSAVSYPLWHENYDDDVGYWRDDRVWIVDNSLKQAKGLLDQL